MKNIYEIIKDKKEPVEVIIEKPIFMGHKDDSDILEFVHEVYLEINHLGGVFIQQQIAKAQYVESNGCIELIFPDEESSCDIMFDTDEEWDQHLSLFE